MSAILHLDADSFFASVEISKNPKLRGRPVVTGQERGIATSMSYDAKALGITRAMTIYQIRRDFPQVAVVASDYEAYAMYSKRMFAIVRRYADRVEEYSIDECFADLEGCHAAQTMTHEEIMRRIQDDIERELRISVSLGCAPTKVLAKIGSKMNKPHGIVVIHERETLDILSRVPVGDIWGVGRSSRRFLELRGILTAQDFASVPAHTIATFRHSSYADLWNELNGRQVFRLSLGPDEKPQSISRTQSFYPLKSDREELFAELARHVENACVKARKYGVLPRALTWFLKTREYRYLSFEVQLCEPTNLPTLIIQEIRKQFDTVDLLGKEYRTTGVTLRSLHDEERMQPDLFGAQKIFREREEIFRAVDQLARKFGRHTVHVASSTKAQREPSSKEGRVQAAFFRNLKRTGKEFCIPYLGEAS